MSRLEKFVADLGRSRLVAADRIERLLAAFPRQPEADAAVRFARQLIREGLLTEYQARKVLAGATRGFFLGDYRVLRSLGEGGMGKVYLAAHNASGEHVAIKVLPPRKAREQAQALQRFRRETDLSTRVNHPNLARTLGYGQEGGVHFMVLEYIPGRSLYDAVRGEGGRPLGVADAARLFVKVADGLAAAHDAGLVHRDIKPSNIMIPPDGQAKLLDLGLARAVGEDRPLTTPNLVVGTLDYASPEQIVNASTADRRSDLYSLGCTLYFALAGRPPFEGGDMINKMFKQRMEDPEPLERVARGVPPTFAAIVRKLMAKNPDHRYQSCGELRADLARWVRPAGAGGHGGDAESPRIARLAHVPVAVPVPAPVPPLDDAELHLLGDAPSDLHAALRDLGDAEPAPAPIRKPPPVPVPAVVVPPGGRKRPADRRVSYVAVAVVVGLLILLALTLFA
jgi:serine/threonine protein kinase